MLLLGALSAYALAVGVPSAVRAEHSIGDFVVWPELPPPSTVVDLAVYPAGPNEGEVVALMRDARSYTIVARFQIDGTLDPSFGRRGLVRLRRDVGDDGPSTVFGRAVSVDRSGHVLVGGSAATGGPFVARLRADGEPDEGFGDEGFWVGDPPGDRSDRSVVDVEAYETATGVTKVAMVIGSYDDHGPPQVYAGRLGPAGILDPTFAGDGIVFVTNGIANDSGGDACCLAIEPATRKIVIASTVWERPTSVDYPRLFAITRLKPDGSVDDAFGVGGTTSFAFGEPSHVTQLWDLDLQESGADAGKIVVVGETGQPDDRQTGAIAKLTPGGALDPGFGDEGRLTSDFAPRAESVQAVAIDAAGRILVAGWGGQGVPETLREQLTQYLPSGELDPSFYDDGFVALGSGRSLTLARDPYGAVLASQAHLDGGEKLQAEIRWFGYRVDSIPPQTWINSAPRRITRDRTPRFRFSTNDPNTYFDCRLDGIQMLYCDSPLDLGPLAPGRHRFTVKAFEHFIDGMEDPTPAIRRWRIRR